MSSFGPCIPKVKVSSISVILEGLDERLDIIINR
jgi:hypothetical protein